MGGTLSTAAFFTATIAESEFSHNFNVGVGVNSATGAAATAVNVRNTVASYNATGLFAQNAILRVAHSVVTGNLFGVGTALGGTLISFGDNNIDGNTNDNTGVLTTIPPQLASPPRRRGDSGAPPIAPRAATHSPVAQ